MYDEHLIMFVMNPNVGVYGWGLYYWVVKLKDGTDPKVKAEFAKWYQNKDDICTGYLAEGDFDFFNGNHMRVRQSSCRCYPAMERQTGSRICTSLPNQSRCQGIIGEPVGCSGRQIQKIYFWRRTEEEIP